MYANSTHSKTKQKCHHCCPTSLSWVRSLENFSCLRYVAFFWAITPTVGPLQLQQKAPVWGSELSEDAQKKSVTAKGQRSTIWGQWIQRDNTVTETQSGKRGWVNRMEWTGHFNLCATENSPMFAWWRQDTLAHHLHGCVWRCKHAIVPSSTIMPIAKV